MSSLPFKYHAKGGSCNKNKDKFMKDLLKPALKGGNLLVPALILAKIKGALTTGKMVMSAKKVQSKVKRKTKTKKRKTKKRKTKKRKTKKRKTKKRKTKKRKTKKRKTKKRKN